MTPSLKQMNGNYMCHFQVEDFKSECIIYHALFSLIQQPVMSRWWRLC